MRCLACNRILSDREATRRGMSSDVFLDLCDHCYSSIADTCPTYDSPLFADEASECEIENEAEKY